MRNFETLGKKKVVVGLVHLLPMPGTPFFQEGDFERSLEKAVQDARALYEGGADGCLIQTVDKVYPIQDEADPVRTAGVAVITHAVAQATGEDFQIGVQIMWNALSASAAAARVAHGIAVWQGGGQPAGVSKLPPGDWRAGVETGGRGIGDAFPLGRGT